MRYPNGRMKVESKKELDVWFVRIKPSGYWIRMPEDMSFFFEDMLGAKIDVKIMIELIKNRGHTHLAHMLTVQTRMTD